jgi:hypothetical protein
VSPALPFWVRMEAIDRGAFVKLWIPWWGVPFAFASFAWRWWRGVYVVEGRDREGRQ